MGERYISETYEYSCRYTRNYSSPKSDDEREALFMGIFGKLNDFAISLGGEAWQEDRVFNVGMERTGKFPTSKGGLLDEDAYYIETLGFLAEKRSSGDSDCPFFNAFYLTQTVSTPIEIEDADPQHHEKLFDHFLQFFPNIMKGMIESLAGPGGSNVLSDYEETNLDEIDPEVRFDIITQAVDGANIPFRLGETVTYSILELGEIIEFATSKTYEIGGTEYPLVAFDSTDNPRKPVHTPENDHLAREYIEDPDEKVERPPQETIGGDPTELILLHDEFASLIHETFNSEDHGAIPYAKHIRDIGRILKRLRRAA